MAQVALIVHTDLPLISQTEALLQNSGYEVAVFQDPIDALNAIHATPALGVLVTRLQFGPDKPHGVAPARMARLQHPTTKILFVGLPAQATYADGLGDFLPAPATPATIAAAVQQAMAG
jgi:FixJ family two-component response regulator